MTTDELMEIEKDNIPQAARSVPVKDLSQIVEWLSEKDDKLRYHALLLLMRRSEYSNDVYPYWKVFEKKLLSENSYQRSIGLMLVAANAKWDSDNRIEETLDAYLHILKDEKPITVRQCIQALRDIIPYKSHLHPKIVAGLLSINLSQIKETMRKLVLFDILTILALIRKYMTNDEIESYISDALSGGILDNKIKKLIETML